MFFGTDGALQDAVLLEGSIGYSVELSSKTTANIGIVYGYLLDEGDFADDGEVYASASISLDYAVSDSITFSPYVSYNEGEEDILGAAAADGAHVGASVSFSF